MTRIKILVGIMLTLGATALLAQQYSEYTVATRGIDAGATSNVNEVITLTKYEDVSVKVKSIAGLAASGCLSGVVKTTFNWSANGVDYLAVPLVMMTTGPVAGTPVVAISNQTMGAVGYLKLTTIQNLTEGVVTTSVRVATKPQRFGK